MINIITTLTKSANITNDKRLILLEKYLKKNNDSDIEIFLENEFPQNESDFLWIQDASESTTARCIFDSIVSHLKSIISYNPKTRARVFGHNLDDYPAGDPRNANIEFVTDLMQPGCYDPRSDCKGRTAYDNYRADKLNSMTYSNTLRSTVREATNGMNNVTLLICCDGTFDDNFADTVHYMSTDGTLDKIKSIVMIFPKFIGTEIQDRLMADIACVLKAANNRHINLKMVSTQASENDPDVLYKRIIIGNKISIAGIPVTFAEIPDNMSSFASLVFPKNADPKDIALALQKTDDSVVLFFENQIKNAAESLLNIAVIEPSVLYEGIYAKMHSTFRYIRALTFSDGSSVQTLYIDKISAMKTTAKGAHLDALNKLYSGSYESIKPSNDYGFLKFVSDRVINIKIFNKGNPYTIKVLKGIVNDAIQDGSGYKMLKLCKLLFAPTSVINFLNEKGCTGMPVPNPMFYEHKVSRSYANQKALKNFFLSIGLTRRLEGRMLFMFMLMVLSVPELEVPEGLVSMIESVMLDETYLTDNLGLGVDTQICDLNDSFFVPFILELLNNFFHMYQKKLTNGFKNGAKLLSIHEYLKRLRLVLRKNTARLNVTKQTFTISHNWDGEYLIICS